jgi:hypothetical protein
MVLVGVYLKGRSDVQEKFDAYKTEVLIAAESQAKESAKVDARNSKLFKDAQNAYNLSLANLRSYYQLRLGKGSGSMPQISGSTTRTDDYSPDNLPPATILAGQCAETTLTLIMLQNFITRAANNAE